jgi:hypothetical protein
MSSLNRNNRIFWAIKAVGIAPDGSTNFTPVKGLQTIGINTTFNLSQVFQIGQSSIYEQVEDTPDVEVTLEKVLDGYPLIYHLATRTAKSKNLIGRANEKCSVAMSIFQDDLSSASGTPNTQVFMSGLYVSNISYSIPLEDNSTESVTLVGDHKVWTTGNFTFTGSLFNNLDSPLSLASGTGGVQRREDFVWGSATNGTNTLLPGGLNGVPGIAADGTNSLRSNGRGYMAHINSVSVSADFGREALNELGTRAPFFRFANFPVEISTDIEVLTSDGDQISVTPQGVAGGGNNLDDERINIVMREGLRIDLGSKNKLQSVNYGGADAGGGNATVTYTYVTYNDMLVTHPQDPTP